MNADTAGIESSQMEKIGVQQIRDILYFLDRAISPHCSGVRVLLLRMNRITLVLDRDRGVHMGSAGTLNSHSFQRPGQTGCIVLYAWPTGARRSSLSPSSI